MPARGKASICCRSIAHSPLEASCRSPQGGATIKEIGGNANGIAFKVICDH